MYTSFSPNNERFGFFVKGSFKCAYDSDRSIIIGSLIALVTLIVLFIVQLVYFFNLFDENGAIKGGIVDMNGAYPKMNSNYINFAASNIVISVSLFLIALSILTFLIIIGFLNSRRSYKFSANETGFTVIYPKKGKEELFLYDRVIGISVEERRFIFLRKGMDVIIKTKNYSRRFRLIHTSASRANGISETPFNIIKERIGLTQRPDYHF